MTYSNFIQNIKNLVLTKYKNINTWTGGNLSIGFNSITATGQKHIPGHYVTPPKPKHGDDNPPATHFAGNAPSSVGYPTFDYESLFQIITTEQVISDLENYYTSIGLKVDDNLELNKTIIMHYINAFVAWTESRTQFILGDTKNNMSIPVLDLSISPSINMKIKKNNDSFDVDDLLLSLENINSSVIKSNTPEMSAVLVSCSSSSCSSSCSSSSCSSSSSSSSSSSCSSSTMFVAYMQIGI